MTPRENPSVSGESENSKESFLSPEEQKKLQEITSHVAGEIPKLDLPIKPGREQALTDLLSALIVRGITLTELEKLKPQDIEKKERFFVPWYNRLMDSGINIDNRDILDGKVTNTNILSATPLLQFFEIRYQQGNHIADQEEDYIQKKVATFLNNTLKSYYQKQDIKK